MYRIYRDDFSGTEQITLLHPESGESVTVIPSFGGNVHALMLSAGNTLHSLIAGSASPQALQGNPVNEYRGAKLSPFPNRIAAGSYMFNQKQYQLPVNSGMHALHGLCWNIPFQVRERVMATNFARLTLEATYNALYRGFPFFYHMEIAYMLEEQSLTCTTRITNTSGIPIPLGDGWHPYLTTGSLADDLVLHIPSGKQLEFNAQQIPTGKYLNTTDCQKQIRIGGDLLDHCYELEDTGIAETRIVDEEKKITVVLWQQTAGAGYRFLQVYTPPDRRSLAIEPMSCAPDAFNNQKGLKILQPQECVEYTFGITLELHPEKEKQVNGK